MKCVDNSTHASEASNHVHVQAEVCQRLFEAQARRSPSAIAVSFGGDALTYEELDSKSNKLARHLRALGAGPNVTVGLCVRRSPKMLVALLGILKAGSAYVPLDPTYPRERLAYMLDSARVPLLVTESGQTEDLPTDSVELVLLDTEWEAIEAHEGHDLDVEASDSDLAYVMFTSGSTGRPKGIAMTHGPLMNLVRWQNAQSRFSGGRTLQYTPLSFDVSFQEIFSTLGGGGTLILIDDQERRDPERLLDALIRYGVQRLFLPFVALDGLASAIDSSGRVPVDLREVVTAGEQLRITPAIASWFGQAPRCTLSNHYGPAESHVVTACTLRGRPDAWPALPPIGRPIDNAEIHLLSSDDLTPVEDGEPGEIYIGGPVLARGYLHQPELTDERFVADPRTEQSGARLYKTGDLARRLPDGQLEFLGRVDQQIKIRGVRIEPGEVESVLERHPSVERAVVAARTDAAGDERLVAYAVGRPTDGTDELRDFAREWLPSAMVPGAIVWLQEFPLTPSGKVDYRALPQPRYGRSSHEVLVDPITSTEGRLVGIWKQILDVDELSIDDDFFGIGGDSLKAIRVVHQVGQDFGLELPMLVLFDARTVRRLAALLDDSLRESRKVTELHIGTTDDITVEELVADTRLDPRIIVDQTRLARTSHPRRVLLTGATGFLGAFLLAELLEQTSAEVYCLVLASEASAASRRLRDNLAKYRLWKPEHADRVVPVPGDLASPDLGLPRDEFDALADTVDSIYHCGAIANLVRPYAELRGANVFGTGELLRLATQGAVKPFHFISTMDVYQTGRAYGLRTIGEHDSLDPNPAINFDGYNKSKWVAESMVERARAEGLPACIYRPAMVSGDSRNGVGNTGDLMNRLIKGFVDLGIAPDLEMAFNLSPVDFISQSTIFLSLQRSSIGKNFNCVDPAPPTLRRLVKMINECGRPVEIVDHETWQRALQEHGETLDGIVPFLTSRASAESTSYIERSSVGAERVSCQNVLEGLEGSGMAIPRITAELLGSYFDFFEGVGFIRRRARSA